MRRFVLALIVLTLLGIPSVGSAHPHQSTAPEGGQVLANGQLHDTDVADGVMCGGDPAAYGLETAHHGPDWGVPGKGDGCYETTNNVHPNDDVENPVIN